MRSVPPLVPDRDSQLPCPRRLGPDRCGRMPRDSRRGGLGTPLALCRNAIWREAAVTGLRTLWAALWLVAVVGAGAGGAAAQTLRVGLSDDPDMLDPSQARTFTG